MKISRLASSMLVAMLTVGLATASEASAAPEFKPTGATIRATSGTSVLTSAGNIVTCAKDTATSGAGVTTATLIGNITVHFLECTGKNVETDTTCPVHSPNSPLGNLILTTTLHGVLGVILPKPASGSDTALVLLPISGDRFVSLEATCLASPSAVTGNVAGLIGSIGVPANTNTLTFGVTAGVQNIKDVDLSTGGLVAPRLTAFTESATLESTEALTFSIVTEIT